VFGIFNAIGVLFFHALASRRKLSINNLTLAYPLKSEKEIYLLAKNSFKSIARTAAEILLVFNNKKNSDDFFVNKDETLEKIKEITKDNKKGIIFISAHFGNWEVLTDFMALHGYPTTVVGREGDNTFIEQNLTKPFRERHGHQNVYKKEAMSKMIRTLKSGGNVALLIDQKAGNTNSVIANFFGRECTTTISPATMKLKYDPLVIPLFAVRENDGKYRIVFDGAADYTAGEKADKNDKILELTQHYNDILESVVAQAPEQWFWVHNRWKIE
jgi:KDO2-lipid IV(A) lauroyltransferase